MNSKKATGPFDSLRDCARKLERSDRRWGELIGAGAP